MKSEWEVGNYGIMYLRIGGFQCVVAWDSVRPKGAKYPGGYKASFDHWTLEKRFAEAQQAKDAAVRLARRKLTAALEALP